MVTNLTFNYTVFAHKPESSEVQYENPGQRETVILQCEKCRRWDRRSAKKEMALTTLLPTSIPFKGGGKWIPQGFEPEIALKKVGLLFHSY